MPSPPRVLFPGTVVLISTRTEEGLPFVPGIFMNLLLASVIARAQHVFPVNLCHFIFMSNHLHMLIVVEDPDAVAHFIERVKTESAHIVNRLLGRRKKTIWCDGYDSPPILTLEDVIEKIAYLYTNPQKADLEDTIEKYPGLSSWKAYQGKQYSETVPWINRPKVKKLSGMSLSEREQRRLANELEFGATTFHELKVCPDEWLRLFGLDSAKDSEWIRTRIVERVRVVEAEHRQRRLAEGVSCIGARRLTTQRFDRPYTPQKFTPRMWCICGVSSIRQAFIERVKAMRTAARGVYDAWCVGETTERYPVGMFPPRYPRLANLCP